MVMECCWSYGAKVACVIPVHKVIRSSRVSFMRFLFLEFLDFRFLEIVLLGGRGEEMGRGIERHWGWVVGKGIFFHIFLHGSFRIWEAGRDGNVGRSLLFGFFYRWARPYFLEGWEGY